MLINGVFSVYVVNYKPKIGEWHLWLCSGLGVLPAVLTVSVVVWGVKQLIKGRGSKKITVTVTVLAVLMGIMWTYISIPYYKDIIGGSKTVTTDSWLVVIDKLYFLDDKGGKVALTIPSDTAKEFREKENYEYDKENNLLKYYDKITITYFPESGVIINASAV
ncbi:MAG: hypothetical protein K2N36_09010 [Ruminiclostridium sp.]|nr:hypothetical protein [Ruminiclostridium sp.]